jgi:hypothetical protein
MVGINRSIFKECVCAFTFHFNSIYKAVVPVAGFEPAEGGRSKVPLSRVQNGCVYQFRHTGIVAASEKVM